MRTAILTFMFLSGMGFLAIAQNSMSDESIKELIRNLEIRETRAVVDKNFEELKKIWAEDFMVNNPFNEVIHDRQEVLDRVESGFINYSSFEREIESMRILDDIVIVMGQETILPLSGLSAGKILKRRYTNIWKQKDGEWQIKIRHANVICGNQED
jgi:sulfur carrier protein ThiS